MSISDELINKAGPSLGRSQCVCEGVCAVPGGRGSSKHTSDRQDSPKKNKVPREMQGKQSAEFRGRDKNNLQERRVYKTTWEKNKWQVFAKT